MESAHASRKYMGRMSVYGTSVWAGTALSSLDQLTARADIVQRIGLSQGGRLDEAIWCMD